MLSVWRAGSRTTGVGQWQRLAEPRIHRRRDSLNRAVLDEGCEAWLRVSGMLSG